MHCLSDIAHQKPLSRALRALILGTAVGAATTAVVGIAPVQAQTASAQRDYAIEAGALEAAIAKFSAMAGVTVSFTPELAKGRSTKGLKGSFSVELGWAPLRAGTGLQSLSSGNGRLV